MIIININLIRQILFFLSFLLINLSECQCSLYLDKQKDFRHQRTKRYSIEDGANDNHALHRMYYSKVEYTCQFCGSYWGKNIITYRLKQASQRMSLDQQLAVFAKAFATWEEHTPLRFIHQADDEKSANIEIVFASGNHGDGESFDGKGNILAHAFFPRYGGGVHFDEDEIWSSTKTSGVDLYAVAVHEIGHALGLKHSFNHLSIMAPFYKQYSGDFLSLHNDDIMAIRRLYGTSEKMHKKALENSLKWKNELCRNPYLDASTKLKNNTIWAFRGKYFFELKKNGKIGLAKEIKSYFPFDGPIDAAITDKNGNIYIFKESNYWILNQTGKAFSEFPKKISIGFSDTPDDISAALHYSDGKPYLFQKSIFWQYSQYGMKQSWPRGIKTIFNKSLKFPARIDAAFQFDPSTSYLFSGDRYWKIIGNPMRIDYKHPRSLGKDWFGC